MKLIWLGHSAFRLEFADKVVLIDPFLTDNPAFAGADFAKATEGTTHILITHGHGDHVGDSVRIAGETEAKVVTNYDLAMWLAWKGVRNIETLNTGGTISVDGFTVTLVRADHSASLLDEQGMSHSLGSANGLIVKAPNEPSVYHMGDTDIFGDMALINEIHQPDIGLVPIGDRFTMGAKIAALAVQRFFTFKAVIPCHYGSFPIIEPTADGFVEAMKGQDTQVVVPHKHLAVTFS